jgi:hypothetical protein
MDEAISMACSPETRMIPMAPPIAVAGAQIVSLFIFLMYFCVRHGMLCPLELVLGRTANTLIMLLASLQLEKM